VHPHPAIAPAPECTRSAVRDESAGEHPDPECTPTMSALGVQSARECTDGVHRTRGAHRSAPQSAAHGLGVRVHFDKDAIVGDLGDEGILADMAALERTGVQLSIRTIRTRYRLGQDRAKALHMAHGATAGADPGALVIAPAGAPLSAPATAKRGAEQ
jgi:hypothetical protein